MWQKLSNLIDKIVTNQGKLSSFLMPILVLLIGFEVFRRYILNAPTIWGLEFTTFLFGIHFIMGFSYTEYFDGHVSVDILTARLPDKIRIILWLIATILFTIPVIGLLLYGAIIYAYESISIWERNSTAWSPYIWPVKLCMPIGFFFLFIQIISNIIKKFKKLGEI